MDTTIPCFSDTNLEVKVPESLDDLPNREASLHLLRPKLTIEDPPMGKEQTIIIYDSSQFTNNNLDYQTSSKLMNINDEKTDIKTNIPVTELASTPKRRSTRLIAKSKMKPKEPTAGVATKSRGRKRKISQRSKSKAKKARTQSKSNKRQKKK